MKKYVIVDLDGTLCDVEHRSHHANNGDWHKFHKAMLKDSPNEWCMELVRLFIKSGRKVIFLTASNQAYEHLRFKWLEKHLKLSKGWKLVTLRGKRDRRPDVQLKKAWLEKFGPDRVLLSIDDRKRNVAMFMNAGVPSLYFESGVYKSELVEEDR